MTVALQYNNLKQYADLVFQNGHFVESDPITTAVLISIFTERRVPSDDLDPSATYQGGWWGDTYREFKIGSRMWTLRRRKATQDTLADAQTFLEECLQWLVNDGVADSLLVTTSRDITRMDMLLFSIALQRPGNASAWQRAWKVQFNEL